MSFGTESGINIATLGQNVKKSKHWRSTLACTRSIQMYLYMLRKKNWKYVVYSRLTLLCHRLAADHLKLGLYWRDFDYQPRRIYFIYPTCQAWLCGFSVVAYLDNSHSHIFSSFRRSHIRSISGATKGGYHPFFTGLSNSINFSFVFALGKWFGVLRLLLRLVLQRLASFLSSKARHICFSVASSVDDGSFVRTDKDFSSGASLKWGPVCGEVWVQTHQRWRKRVGKLRPPREGEFNGAIKWERVRSCWRFLKASMRSLLLASQLLPHQRHLNAFHCGNATVLIKLKKK